MLIYRFSNDEMTDENKTLEAQEGNFYFERMEELRSAIRAEGGEDAEEKIRSAQEFVRLANNHHNYVLMARESGVRDGIQFWNEMAAAHNRVIRKLNDLNGMAEKYGTTRFTPREFWTNEIQNRGGAVKEKCEADRAIVEAYYTVALG